MPRFTELHGRIIAVLSDQEGHANWDISRRLNRYEGNIKNTIDNLKEMGIIYRGEARDTTNPKSKRPKQQEFPLFITLQPGIFYTIIKELNHNEQFDVYNTFISSNYVSDLIKKYGFEQIFVLIERELYNPYFRKGISKSLLRLSSVKGEFEEYGNAIQQFVLENDERIVEDIIMTLSSKKVNLNTIFNPFFIPSQKEKCELDNEKRIRLKKNNLDPLPLKKLDILSQLDPLEAVLFHRDLLNSKFELIYSELENRYEISQPLQHFLVTDNYLSPLTSYPYSSPIQLLFSRPFQRIYDDTYVLKREDLSRMLDRTYTIFDSFADILYIFFKDTDMEREYIKILTEEMVFYWNTNCYAFDIIFKYLYHFYLNETGSGKFHVKSEGLKLQIYDLESNEPMQHNYAAETLPAIFFLPCIVRESDDGTLKTSFMQNPFTCLRPSNTFENNKTNTEMIPIETILNQLEAKLNTNN